MLGLCVLGVVACAPTRPLARDRGLGGDPVEHLAVEEVPSRGFEVTVREADGSEHQGELLASGDEAIWLWSHGAPVQILVSRVLYVTLTLYPSRVAPAVAATLAGTASTVANGWFLIFTAPAWLITGGITIAREASGNGLTVQHRDLASLYQYARFPQGLPPGFVSGQPGAPSGPLAPAPAPPPAYEEPPPL